jgi:hypothetical protein
VMQNSSVPSLAVFDLAILAALERLSESHAQYARNAIIRDDKSSAALFTRESNAYARALGYYQAGVRPVATPHGYVLPSQRPGEAPHQLTLDGDWTCTCPAGESMHWAKALIIGIEVAHDDMQRLDSGDDGEQDSDPPTPITVRTAPGGLSLTRHGVTELVTTPTDLVRAIRRLTAQPAQLGRRLAWARVRYLAA